MDELEKTKIIIESKFYSEIFDAITNYLQEFPESFCYDSDICYRHWFELGLLDYKIIKLYSLTDQEIKILDIIVEASIKFLDIEDIGLNCTMTEKLHIEANVDIKYENFEVVDVGQYIS